MVIEKRELKSMVELDRIQTSHVANMTWIPFFQSSFYPLNCLDHELVRALNNPSAAQIETN